MNKLSIAPLVAISVLVLSAQVTIAQTSASDESRRPSTDQRVAPDNTKSNEVDPSNRDQTADNQKNASSDIDVTRRIRRSVISDKSLSTYGHNVKIVTARGTVTLNGVVRTDDEKTKVAMKAAAVVGNEHVVNKIKVAPRK